MSFCVLATWKRRSGQRSKPWQGTVVVTNPAIKLAAMCRAPPAFQEIMKESPQISVTRLRCLFQQSLPVGQNQHPARTFRKAKPSCECSLCMCLDKLLRETHRERVSIAYINWQVCNPHQMSSRNKTSEYLVSGMCQGT